MNARCAPEPDVRSAALLTHFGRRPVSQLIFECIVGVTAAVAAASEIANIIHETFESQSPRARSNAVT
jgi:hypothetical protein